MHHATPRRAVRPAPRRAPVARSLAQLGIVLACAGCDAAADPGGGPSDPIVHGLDGRREVYQADDERLAQVARQSIVALMADATVDERDPEHVTFDAPSLGTALDLCEGERFRDQPAAAGCSGSLIADDLVLTAGHCFSAPDGTAPLTPEQVCARVRLVFGYYYDAPGVLHPVTSADVFRCAEIVARREDPSGTVPALDYAVVRLDRAATPRFAPAALELRRRTLDAGTPLGLVGFGSGLPAKVQSDADSVVRDPRAAAGDWFSASTDTFVGDSGSIVFDTTTHNAVGILLSGYGDDYVDAGGCMRANVCTSGSCTRQFEQVGYLAPILDAVCQARPELSLCAQRSWAP